MTAHRAYTVETIQTPAYVRPAVVRVTCECGEAAFCGSSTRGLLTDNDPRGVGAGILTAEATERALALFMREHSADDQLSLFSV